MKLSLFLLFSVAAGNLALPTKNAWTVRKTLRGEVKKFDDGSNFHDLKGKKKTHHGNDSDRTKSKSRTGEGAGSMNKENWSGSSNTKGHDSAHEENPNEYQPNPFSQLGRNKEEQSNTKEAGSNKTPHWHDKSVSRKTHHGKDSKENEKGKNGKDAQGEEDMYREKRNDSSNGKAKVSTQQHNHNESQRNQVLQVGPGDKEKNGTAEAGPDKKPNWKVKIGLPPYNQCEKSSECESNCCVPYHRYLCMDPDVGGGYLGCLEG